MVIYAVAAGVLGTSVAIVGAQELVRVHATPVRRDMDEKERESERMGERDWGQGQVDFYTGTLWGDLHKRG